MKKLMLALLCFVGLAFAQVQSIPVLLPSAPTGDCTVQFYQIAYVASTNTMYYCNSASTSHAWTASASGGGTVTVAAGKTFTVNNTLTLAGTDSTTMTFPTTSATIARTDAANTFTGTQTIGALVATTINGNTFTAGTATLTLAGNLITTGAFNTTFAQGATTTVTLPTTSSTMARTDAGQTFTGAQVFSSPILGTSGGTGVNNGAFTITLAGNVATTGAFNTTFAQGGTTTVTLPTTSSTMARTDAAQTFTGLQTFGAVTETGAVTNNGSYAGTAILGGTQGGTGVNNGGSTITLAGNLVTTGAFNTTFAQGGTTTVTLPTTSSTMARTDAGQTFTGVSTATAWNVANPVITGPAGVNCGATCSPTAGQLSFFNLGAGSTATLPTSSGSGNVIRFRITVANSSAQEKILLTTTSDVIIGTAIGENAGTAKVFVGNAAANHSIQMPFAGTQPSGGFVGDDITCTDIATGTWACDIRYQAGTTPTTPYSTSTT